MESNHQPATGTLGFYSASLSFRVHELCHNLESALRLVGRGRLSCLLIDVGQQEELQWIPCIRH